MISDKVKVVNYLELKALLKEKGLVYLLISTPTCSSCITMKPVVKWLAEKSEYADKFQFVEIDFNENVQLLGDIIDVNAMPTTIVFKDGKMVDKFLGMPVTLSMDAFIVSAYTRALGS